MDSIFELIIFIVRFLEILIFIGVFLLGFSNKWNSSAETRRSILITIGVSILFNFGSSTLVDVYKASELDVETLRIGFYSSMVITELAWLSVVLVLHRLTKTNLSIIAYICVIYSVLVMWLQVLGYANSFYIQSSLITTSYQYSVVCINILMGFAYLIYPLYAVLVKFSNRETESV